jgi:hypothetical protein
VGGRSLAFILIGLIFGRILGERYLRQCEQASLVGGVEKKLLVSAVLRNNKAREDRIVYPTSPPP